MIEVNEDDKIIEATPDQEQAEELASDDQEVQSSEASEDVSLEEEDTQESPSEFGIVKEHIRGVIEAILFVSEKPVTIEQLKKVLDTVGAVQIKNTIQELQKDYQQREAGMHIIELAGGYQLLTNPHYASYVRDFYKKKYKERLSKPALESLAIIAYKQPVTRGDVEEIRGVNSDGVISTLEEKELIKIVGKKDVPGHPYIYGTTKQFLEHFGLKSLESLPKLEEFSLIEPDADVDDADGFIPINSLEQMKQGAIHDKDDQNDSSAETSNKEVAGDSETADESEQQEIIQEEEEKYSVAEIDAEIKETARKIKEATVKKAEEFVKDAE